jgi:hypothetical protein
MAGAAQAVGIPRVTSCGSAGKAYGTPWTRKLRSAVRRTFLVSGSSRRRSLHDYVVKEMLITREAAGRAEKISYVKKLFKDGRVAVGDFENVTMTVGAVLYFVTDHSCATVTVESIQVNDAATNSVAVTARIELGLGLHAAVRKDARIFGLIEPPAPPPQAAAGAALVAGAAG